MQTTPSGLHDKYGRRRTAIRGTFLQNLTSLEDVEAKFVVGRSSEVAVRAAFAREVAKTPEQYLQLDMEARHPRMQPFQFRLLDTPCVAACCLRHCYLVNIRVI
jgi:hypothetical protein